MKMVTAVIQPFRLDAVVDALAALRVERFTIAEVRGVGRTPPPKRIDPDVSMPAPLPRRIMLEVAVGAARLPEVVAAIRGAALSGKPGDGKIFVCDLERVVRVRDGATEG
jgi:nitrogen regulatory protein P-II 2